MKFRSAEAVVPFQAHGIEPKLGLKVFPLDVHMRWLVTVGRVEKEPVWSGPENRRQLSQGTFLGQRTATGCSAIDFLQSTAFPT
jgi:hypothetical protein